MNAYSLENTNEQYDMQYNNTSRVLLKRSNPINQNTINKKQNGIVSLAKPQNNNNLVRIKRSSKQKSTIRYNLQDIQEVIDSQKRLVIKYVIYNITLIRDSIHKLNHSKKFSDVNMKLMRSLETFQEYFLNIWLNDSSIEPEKALQNVKQLTLEEGDNQYEVSLKNLLETCKQYIDYCEPFLNNIKSNNMYAKLKNYLYKTETKISNICTILKSFSRFLQYKLPRLNTLILNPNPTKQTLIELNKELQ